MGSEMCIRDSSLRVHPLLKKILDPPLLLVGFDIINGYFAVSSHSITCETETVVTKVPRRIGGRKADKDIHS